MRSSKYTILTISLLFLPLAARSQSVTKLSPPDDPLSIQPSERVTQPIDETQLFVLRGNVHPLALAVNEVGEVPPGQAMEHMVLVLRRDAMQQGALEELIRAQQDPESRYYHQWLTPEAYGERFGIAENDLVQVANWLAAHEMNVEETSPSRDTMVFSGTAGQVEAAFHTSLRRYRVRGEEHLANANDPEIPLALAEVIQGVVSLHDFFSAAEHVAVPAYTASPTFDYLTPLDWDAIYDVGPLFSQGLTGSGENIAILGRADINLTDVRTFRSEFGLPAKDPQIIVNGADPGSANAGDDLESALDVEWAGAIARSATVTFVTSKSTSTDGIALSAQYAVAHNVAPIVSVSYGLCEASEGNSGNAFWNQLWGEAAAQGQSVLVAAGDAGAAGCDSASAATATHGKGVNGMCSTPYSTCVGGTEFNDTSNPSAYWGATNGAGGESALGYIPELTWNQSGPGDGLWASGGGASIVYAKPAWQVAPGVPNDHARDVPDVAVAASTHDGYLVQLQGNVYVVGGTSASTPSFASVLALVLQNASLAQGNVNSVLYTLANQQYGAGGAALFHDITSGNNSVPGLTGYNAGPGFDQTTGLGSVDAFMLVNHWSGHSAANFLLTANSFNPLVGDGNSNVVVLSESAEGGFGSSVTLSVSGAPAGMAVQFSSPTLSPSAPVTALISAASTVAAGTHTLTFTGTGGGLTRTLALAVTVASHSFTMTISPASASVAPGGSASLALATTVVNGFSSAITFSVSGLPSGVTATFSPASITAPGSGKSTLTLKIASSTAPGVYALIVSGTGGGLNGSQIVSLTVASATASKK